MDGPVHFIHGAAGLDEMPLNATMGEARVIEIEHPREITADEIGKHRLQAGERVLFRTSNSARCWHTDSFVEDFVGLSEQAAMYLAETGVQTVGIDYLSVGGYHANGPGSTRSCSRRGSGSSRDLTCLQSPAAGTR
jgi:arylformamidase